MTSAILSVSGEAPARPLWILIAFWNGGGIIVGSGAMLKNDCGRDAR